MAALRSGALEAERGGQAAELARVVAKHGIKACPSRACQFSELLRPAVRLLADLWALHAALDRRPLFALIALLLNSLCC